MTPRWRVRPADEPDAVRIEIDTGRGFRPATIAEIDQALRQLPLFGAADTAGGGPVDPGTPKEQASASHHQTPRPRRTAP